MTPDAALAILSAILGFFLQTTFAFCICWILNLMLESPRWRFRLWLSFLAGAHVYWIYLAYGFFTSSRLSSSTSHPLRHASASSLLHTSWQVPEAWAVAVVYGVYALASIYLFTALIFLVAAVRKRLHLNWVLRFTTMPPKRIVDIFAPIAGELHVENCSLRVLAGLTSPATVGWLVPVILLPETCLEQSKEEVADVLRHELHHIRRHDFLWERFALLCRAFLFFQPGVKYAMEKLRFERELACDLAVVEGSPERRAAYAEFLVRYTRMSLLEDRASWGIDFAAPALHLKARLSSILAAPKRLPVWLTVLRTIGRVAVPLGSAGVLPLLAVALYFQQPQQFHNAETTVRPTGLPVRHLGNRKRPTLLAATFPVRRDVLHDPTLSAINSAANVGMPAFSQPTYSEGEPSSLPAEDFTVTESDTAAPQTASGRFPLPKGSKVPGMPSVSSVVVGIVRVIGSIHDHDRD